MYCGGDAIIKFFISLIPVLLMLFEFFRVFCLLASTATQQMHSQRSTCGIYNDVIDNSLPS